MGLVSVTYVSGASKPMSATTLLALLQQCRDNNPTNNITGLLLFANDTFLQTLEGEEQVVDELVEKISRDPRHTGIQVLRRQAIDSRRYPDWSMGYSQVTDRRLSEMDGIKEFGITDFKLDTILTRPQVAEALLEKHQSPHWDPLIRELDAKERVIAELKGALVAATEELDTATLILEAVLDASRNGILSAQHVELCQNALQSLRRYV